MTNTYTDELGEPIPERDSGSDTYTRTPSSGDSSEPEAAPQLVFENLNEWVREWLRFAYPRRITGRNAPWWSGEWWCSQEAMLRLEALWRSWEHLRLDPALGMSSWYRDHADQHMRVLMSEDGPFRGCKDASGEDNTLPHVEPPPGLFTLTKTQLWEFNETKE